MTLQQLRYALALNKYGNYKKAARSIGISQPALTLQIQKLEATVGITLFNRKTKIIQPTEDGERFLEKAQTLVTQAAQLQDFAIELREEFAGEIAIGIIPTLAPYILPLFISELHQSYPQLKVHIEEAITEDIIDEIKASNLHGGIIATPIQSKTPFQINPLFYEKFLLFVSYLHPLYPKDAIAVDEIPLKDLWLLREGNCFRDQVNNICEIAKVRSAKSLFYYESNSIEALCRVVEHKAGITFLPELTTLHLGGERESMIKKIADQKYIREISMMYLPSETRRGTLDEVAKVIQRNIPKHMLDPGELKPLATHIRIA